MQPFCMQDTFCINIRFHERTDVYCCMVIMHASQDSYGDTGLHDAVSKDNTELIDFLLNMPSVELLLRNARGFNVLHHAALKGNT